MNEALLQVEHLTKIFPSGIIALDDISFSLGNGEILGIVGESGCGKSTLLRTILQLLPSSSGSVIFSGRNLAECRGKQLLEIRKDIQMVFQDSYSALDSRMKIGKAIAEPLFIHSGRKERASRAWIENRVLELLDAVSLDRSLANQYPAVLSGGERQRVGIARALALSPRLILLDEPVSALDVSVEAQILSLINSAREEKGTSFIIVSHDLSAIRSISDRIIVMYLGRIVEEGRNEDLSKNPIHPYTKALLSALPDSADRMPLNGEARSERSIKGCPFFPRCRERMDKCRTDDPPTAVHSPGHTARCWR